MYVTAYTIKPANSVTEASPTHTRTARANAAAAAQQVQALFTSSNDSNSSSNASSPIDLRSKGAASSSPTARPQQLVRRSPGPANRGRPGGPSGLRINRTASPSSRPNAPSGRVPGQGSGPLIRRVDERTSSPARGGFNRGGPNRGGPSNRGRGGPGRGGRGGRGPRRRQRGAAGEAGEESDAQSVDIVSTMPGRFLEAALAQPATHPAPVAHNPVAPAREQLVRERTAVLAGAAGGMQVLAQRVGLASLRMRGDWAARDALAQRFAKGEVVQFADDAEREAVLAIAERMAESKKAKIEERKAEEVQKDDMTFEPVHEGLRKQLLGTVVKGEYAMGPEGSGKTWDERLVRTVEAKIALNGSYVASDARGIMKKVRSLIDMQPNRGARPTAR